MARLVFSSCLKWLTSLQVPNKNDRPSCLKELWQSGQCHKLCLVRWAPWILNGGACPIYKDLEANFCLRRPFECPPLEMEKWKEHIHKAYSIKTNQDPTGRAFLAGWQIAITQLAWCPRGWGDTKRQDPACAAKLCHLVVRHAFGRLGGKVRRHPAGCLCHWVVRHAYGRLGGNECRYSAGCLCHLVVRHCLLQAGWRRADEP